MRELKVVAATLLVAGLAVATTPSKNQTIESTDVGTGASAPAGPVTQVGDVDDGTSTATPTPRGGSSPTGSYGNGPASPTAPGSAPADNGDGGGATPQPPTGTGAIGPGITDDTITVGIGWFDVNGAAGAFGAPGQYEGTSPTTKEGAQRVVDWMNANGGIAGRQIVPAYHEYPIHEIGTNDSRDRREQAMCADWTEDHIAFAAIPFQDGQGVFHRCAADHGLISLSTFNAGGVIDKKLFAEMGHTFWRPNWIMGERRERIVVEQLDRRGFFEPGARVGLFLGDVPPSRRTAENALKPALAERGVNVVAEVYARDLSDNWSSHVFQFQSAGVTHIVGGQSSCGAGVCLALIQRAAENQGYRPKWGVGSDWGAGSAKLYAPPPAQMANTVSIGWRPATDLDPDDYTAAEPINDYDARCRQIIADSGLDIAMHLVAPYCEGLFFLKDGLERSSEPTWQGFRQAVESAGTSLVSVTAYGTTFGPGRHDGASFVRDMRYDRDCDCWHYEGPPIPIG